MQAACAYGALIGRELRAQGYNMTLGGFIAMLVQTHIVHAHRRWEEMGLVARKLRERGVMGINERNAEFTLVYNERARYPLVDDKLLTKELATKAGASVPRLYGVIEIEHQVQTLAALLAGQKAALGYGDDGDARHGS